MGIKEALGLEPEKKLRYAIVGLGDIAQEDMMPGVEHTGNSEITALVTSAPTKASELSKKYGVQHTFSYEQFDEALASGTFDAIYLATPNWRHAKFIILALKAGIHVLTEKPLEISTKRCEEIMAAERDFTGKLMVVYVCTLSRPR
jgi:predicted dehydrogenase